MTRPQHHDTSAAPAPSAYAAERLRGDVTREIADLRCRLREATLRSDAYLAAGRPDAAAEVLAEQRALVVGFHDRIATSVSGARVEAEAEAVLTNVGLAGLTPGQDESASPTPASPAPASPAPATPGTPGPATPGPAHPIPAVASSPAGEATAGRSLTRHLAGLAAAGLVAVAGALIALPSTMPEVRMLGTSDGGAPDGVGPQSTRPAAIALPEPLDAAPRDGDDSTTPADRPSDAATRAADRTRDEPDDTLVSRVAALIDRAADRITAAAQAVPETAADTIEPTAGGHASLQDRRDEHDERDAEDDPQRDAHDDAHDDGGDASEDRDEDQPLDPLPADDAGLGSDGDRITGIHSD